ncbi:putative extracellular enveloped virion protein [Equine molluscum contagiosum-like virus]|nr:putative extracellular enveloped virion protein [Equine molluscum contagiosum-like virus]
MDGFRVLSQFSLPSVRHLFSTDFPGARRIQTPSPAPYGIPGDEVTLYCNVGPILEQVCAHFDATTRITPLANTCTYQLFGQGKSLYSVRDLARTHLTLLICLQAPRKGGDLVLKPHCHERVILTPRAGLAVVVGNLADYDVTSVPSGRLVLASIAFEAPSLCSRVFAHQDVVLSNSAIIFEQPSVRDLCFAYMLVVDDETKDTVREQVLLNGQWHTVLQIVSSGQRVAVRAEDTLSLANKPAFVPPSVEALDERLVQRVADLAPPYADAQKEVSVYLQAGRRKVCTVYTMYGRLLSANV